MKAHAEWLDPHAAWLHKVITRKNTHAKWLDSQSDREAKLSERSKRIRGAARRVLLIQKNLRETRGNYRNVRMRGNYPLFLRDNSVPV